MWTLGVIVWVSIGSLNTPLPQPSPVYHDFSSRSACTTAMHATQKSYWGSRNIKVVVWCVSQSGDIVTPDFNPGAAE